MESEDEVEKRPVDIVRSVISLIGDAESVDEVVAALYSLAVRLFPLRPCDVSGSVSEQFRHQFRDSEVPSEGKRTQWRKIFYRDRLFRTFSRVLLYDVACNWLACFPASARKHVYDVFFLKGSAAEVVQVMVPCLQCSRSSGQNQIAVSMNVERLIEYCFLENNMACQVAKEIAGASEYEKPNSHEQLKQIAQLMTSIPDKARQGASASLSAHVFYKRISSELLHALEDLDLMSVEADGIDISYATVFVGETFARICRRGSADVLSSEVIPQILEAIRRNIIPQSNPDTAFKSKPGMSIWLKVMEAVGDSHAVQRIAEEALHQLVIHDVTDVEGYWALWVLFSRLYQHRSSSPVRSMFLEKFLLWKVFPLRCLRWIIHFAVLQRSPDCAESEHSSTGILTETVQHLVVAWSKKEFVQSSPTEQQAYVTAALGLCLEKMNKQDLDATKDGLRLILQGVSCRLESPAHVIRKMASAVAFVFSKIIDPRNPLYLDDADQMEAVDWEFGLSTGSASKGALRSAAIKNSKEKATEKENFQVVKSGKEVKDERFYGSSTSKAKPEPTRNTMDPDEVIDPAELNKESRFDDEHEEGGNESDDSDTSSSLQPYDLMDDAEDLKQRISKLVDLIAAFRKTDDYDAVENALDIAEKLIRASPCELKYSAGDLARALVQIRCSDFTPEGEEESAEEKREKALVALIVTCPLESLDCLNGILYSPNLDVSQRIMILDVMTEAAQELANSTASKSEWSSSKPPLISSVSSPNSWLVPSPGSSHDWKEIPPSGNSLPWTYSWERVLSPLKASQPENGKTRRWSRRTTKNLPPTSQNCFPQYAAAFMLPSMQGFDRKRQGVDLINRDFIVLGKLIYMLAICIKCAAMHPEASVLASPLLNMLRSREICHHAEAYVRRSVLFAALCIVSALHPAYVASAVAGEGSSEIFEGLEWIRSYALQIADSEMDRECHGLAMGCLKLHAEMALQASRAFEYHQEDKFSITLSPALATRSGSIIIPYR